MRARPHFNPFTVREPDELVKFSGIVDLETTRQRGRGRAATERDIYRIRRRRDLRPRNDGERRLACNRIVRGVSYEDGYACDSDIDGRS